MTKKTFILCVVSDRNFFIPADVIKIGFNAFQEPSMVSNRIWGWIGFCGQTLPQPHHQIFTESRFRIGSSNSNYDHDDIVPSKSKEDNGTNVIWKGLPYDKGFLDNSTIVLVQQLAKNFKRDLSKVVRSWLYLYNLHNTNHCNEVQPFVSLVLSQQFFRLHSHTSTCQSLICKIRLLHALNLRTRTTVWAPTWVFKSEVRFRFCVLLVDDLLAHVLSQDLVQHVVHR